MKKTKKWLIDIIRGFCKYLELGQKNIEIKVKDKNYKIVMKDNIAEDMLIIEAKMQIFSF